MAWLSREVAPVVKAYAEEYAKVTKAAPGLPQQEAFARLSGIRKEYCDQFLQLAKGDPTGWPAVQALTYGAQSCDADQSLQTLEEICQLALKHHSESPHITAIVKAMSQQPADAAREFCRRVAEVSPHEMVRVGASVSLGANLIQWLQNPDSIELAKLRDRRAEINAIITNLEKAAKTRESPISGQTGDSLVLVLRQQLDAIRIGLKAPEIEGVDIEGKQFKLSDYLGKTVLLDFFAHWCPYCRRMYPSERAMVERLRNRPFVLLGVHCESQQVLDKLVNDRTVTWRCWADGAQGPIARNWAIEAYPTMALVEHGRAALAQQRCSQ
jgi:thiol-disulfide isomerase/thioredoxin